MLAFVRHPAGEPDHLKGGADAAIDISCCLLVGGGGGGEKRAGGGATGAIDERIGGAHSLELCHEREGIGIAHGMGFDIRNGEREAGALQETTSIAHLRHGRNARRGAAGDQGISRKEGLTQFGEAFAAKHGDKKKAIRLQFRTKSRHVAGHVIDSLEVEEGDNEVELSLGQIGKVEIAKGFDGGELNEAGGSRDLPWQKIDIGGDEHGFGKVTHIGAKAIGQIIEDEIAHKVVAVRTPGKVAGDEGGIEQAGRLGHAGLFIKFSGQMGRPRSNMVLMESEAREVKAAQRWLQVLTGGQALARALVDQLYPPVCAACSAPIEGGHGLCAQCFSQLQPITAPLCPILGLPFEVALGPDAVSAEALADAPPFERARAAVRYGAVAEGLVSRLKYGDRIELAEFCARLMLGAGHEFWAAKPLLVPVPLHASRIRFRRYNQSLLLARALGKVLELPVDPLLLRRHKKTRSQIGLSGDGRARNVQGAFSAHPDAVVRLKGRRVVLIDDVYTTGATVKAATRALKRGGAEAVDVLTFARVVRGEEVPI